MRLLNFGLISFSNLYTQDFLSVLIENNSLKFDNGYFNQITATAVGAIFAPTYANLTLGFFEFTYFDLCRNKFGEDLRNFIFENWSGFLNNCEISIEENKINPNDLRSILNSINPSVKFTMEYSKMPFFSWTF